MNKSTLEEQIRRHLESVNASELDWLVFDIMDVAEDYARNYGKSLDIEIEGW
tara:strand:- start:210 stop:365 length:156 start_codon:yes stop_codon:yes gene_type:complete